MHGNGPSFTFGLEKSEDVVLADGALDVADDGARGVVDEFDADLCDTTTRASAAEDLKIMRAMVRYICSGRVVRDLECRWHAPSLRARA